MAQTKQSESASESKRPNLMQEFESPLSLRETIELLTPRWAKRPSRRGPLRKGSD